MGSLHGHMTFQTFFVEGNAHFFDFVKSEGATVKNQLKSQLKSLPKKDFLKVHEATFLSFSEECRGVTATLSI